jgi:hypothetical protein
MRVARWLDNSPTGYWDQPIIYQKKRSSPSTTGTSCGHFQQRVCEQQSPPCRTCCVRKASGIGVQKSRSQGTHIFLPREPITLLDSETNSRNRLFSNNVVWNWNFKQFRVELEFQFHTRLFENNRFRKFVSTDRYPSELNP